MGKIKDVLTYIFGSIIIFMQYFIIVIALYPYTYLMTNIFGLPMFWGLVLALLAEGVLSQAPIIGYIYTFITMGVIIWSYTDCIETYGSEDIRSIILLIILILSSIQTLITIISLAASLVECIQKRFR